MADDFTEQRVPIELYQGETLAQPALYLPGTFSLVGATAHLTARETEAAATALADLTSTGGSPTLVIDPSARTITPAVPAATTGAWAPTPDAGAGYDCFVTLASGFRYRSHWGPWTVRPSFTRYP